MLLSIVKMQKNKIKYFNTKFRWLLSGKLSNKKYRLRWGKQYKHQAFNIFQIPKNTRMSTH